MSRRPARAAALSPLVPLALVAALALASAPAAAQQWAISLGTTGFLDDGGPLEDRDPVEVGIEYRLRPRTFFDAVELVPMVGVSATEDESAWVFAGLRWDWEVSPSWVVTPHFAITLYDEGDGKDLGGVVEFRSGLEVSRRFAGGSRLGLSFYHLSNAGIYDRNPGVESLVLVWAFGP